MKKVAPFLGAWLLFLMLSAAAASAQDSALRRPAVITMVRGSGEEIDGRVQSIVVDILELELEGAGFEVLPEEEIRRASFPEGLPEFSRTVLIQELARRTEGDFLLETVVTAGEEEIRLDFYLADLRRQDLVTRISRQSLQDILLDQTIASAVDELAASLSERVAQAGPRENGLLGIGRTPAPQPRPQPQPQPRQEPPTPEGPPAAEAPPAEAPPPPAESLPPAMEAPPSPAPPPPAQEPPPPAPEHPPPAAVPPPPEPPPAEAAPSETAPPQAPLPAEEAPQPSPPAAEPAPPPREETPAPGEELPGGEPEIAQAPRTPPPTPSPPSPPPTPAPPAGAEPSPGAAPEGPESGILVPARTPPGPFRLAAGFSPFLVIGQATDYFRLGYQGALSATYCLETGFGCLDLGLFTAVQIFQAEGQVASSDNLLIPFGPLLRLSFALGRLWYAHLQATGGPAVITMAIDGQDPVAKLIPYVLGGIGLGVNFTRSFGLALDLNYAAFFEEAFPIMGFAPALALTFRM